MDTQVSKWQAKHWLALVGLVLLAAIVIVAIVRDRIVNQQQWTVTVVGRAEIPYTPDEAVVNLGVQIDRAVTAENALNQLNARVEKIKAAVMATGIEASNITTQNYSVYALYDYVDQRSVIGGYSANQQLLVTVTDFSDDSQLLENVIAEASKAGANQVNGVTYALSNSDDLKQQARLEAIANARARAGETATAAGVQLKKVVGWWENFVQTPDMNTGVYGAGGYGGGGGGPVIPTGEQKIIVEVNVNYQIK